MHRLRHVILSRHICTQLIEEHPAAKKPQRLEQNLATVRTCTVVEPRLVGGRSTHSPSSLSYAMPCLCVAQYERFTDRKYMYAFLHEQDREQGRDRERDWVCVCVCVCFVCVAEL